jgi:3-hydroxyisobutyrate dehydrogenase
MNHSRIAFLGLGAMGQRMASRLAAAGHSVVAWNRSAPASAPAGVTLAATAALAVADVTLALAMVTDDDASRALWLGPSGALAALPRGATVVECSTLTPGWVTELAGHARAAGLTFVEAPVVGSRPQAEAGALSFLVGGEPAAVEQLRPVLATMGGAVHHLGATPAGSYGKLIVNTLFASQLATLAEMLGMARHAALDSATLLRALEALPVTSPAAKAAAATMVAGNFAPQFTVALVEKDLRYTAATAAALGQAAPVAGAVRDVFTTALRNGLAQDNATAVAMLYP